MQKKVKILQPKERNEQTGEYWKILNAVKDPEIDVGIVDLGLVYDIINKNGYLTVTMTLTSMGCPMGPEIVASVEEILRTQKNVRDVKIHLVWEPAWSPERMHPDIREILL